MIVVVSQPMYFPWVGLLEQMMLSQLFVYYDDVQFTRGFYNRVEIKTDHGEKWMTIPLHGFHRGQLLNEVRLDDRQDWRNQHRSLLMHAHQEAPYRDEMIDLFDRAVSMPADSLADIARASTMVLAEYFGLDRGRQFVSSSTLGISGHSSQRLLDICVRFGGSEYVTGHGARNYLDHALFERHGISVNYMDYLCKPYPQAHPPFTPYVSALDLVANCGRGGLQYICSGTRTWKEFLNEPD
jgi:hypothetical protein